MLTIYDQHIHHHIDQDIEAYENHSKRHRPGGSHLSFRQALHLVAYRGHEEAAKVMLRGGNPGTKQPPP